MLATADYSAKMAAKAAGCSYRQVDYWDITGVVCPSLSERRGSGSRRCYDSLDVEYLRLASLMRKAGVELDVIRSVMRELRAYGENPGEFRHVVVVGHSVLCLNTDRELLDFISDADGWYWVRSSVEAAPTP